MAYTPLSTSYKNDILDTDANTEVRYQVTEHSSNVISLEDVTVYTQVGDTFDASVLNGINSTVNGVGEDVDDLLAGKVNLNTSAIPGTVDGDLYAALSALGWTSVID